MTDPTTALREVLARMEETDNAERMPDDPALRCVFVDMRPEEFRAALDAAIAAALAQQPAAVDGDNPYPAPRNRQEAVALAKLALAYLGVTSAHIDAVVARCETDLAAQQGGSDNDH